MQEQENKPTETETTEQEPNTARQPDTAAKDEEKEADKTPAESGN